MKEIELFRPSTENEVIETVYFGGGTPSLLEIKDIHSILNTIKNRFTLSENAEITLEANPDDITAQQLGGWETAGINRLSIGVQSFFEDDLRWMNRAHNATQAFQNVQLARTYFTNITIDLIYGSPGLSNEKWQQNVRTALSLAIPHFSCYALTVEPKTPLHKQIQQHRKEDINPSLQSEQFLLLMDWMQAAGYEHYEISNFAQPGFRSRHNSSYWQGKNYYGFGPSAHSYNGKERWWNIANNNNYIQSILAGTIPAEKEVLTPVQQVNELIMIGLRTKEGIDLRRFEETVTKQVRKNAGKYIKAGTVIEAGSFLQLTNEGKLLADGIAADLFVG